METSNPPDQTPEPAVPPNLTPDLIKSARSACFGCAGQFLIIICIGISVGYFLAGVYGWSGGIAFLASVFVSALLLFVLGRRAQAQPGSSLAIVRRTFRGLRGWPKDYSNRLFDKWGDSEPWWFKALNVAALFPAAIIWLGNNEIGKYWTKLLHLQDLLGWSRNPLYAGALTVFPIAVGALSLKVRQANVKRKTERLKEMDELHEISASHGGKVARSLGSKTNLSPEQERILAESAVRAMTVVTRAKGIRSCVLRIRGASFDKGGYFPESSHPRTGLATLNNEHSSASRARRTTSMVVVQDVRVEQGKPEPRFLGDPERPDLEGSHISYPIQHPRSGTVVAVLTLWCDEPGTFKEGKPADIYRDLLRNLSDAAFVLQSTARSPRR